MTKVTKMFMNLTCYDYYSSSGKVISILPFLVSCSDCQGQANEEQKKKWLPLAMNYKILGAYAQTELGHGK